MSVVAAERGMTGPVGRRGWVHLRRGLFFLLILATAAFAGAVMADILSANGMTAVKYAILVVFLVNIAWLATSFWAAIFGFVLSLIGGDPYSLEGRGPLAETPITTRTAVVMPIYNEDTVRVFSGIEAIYRSLEQAGGFGPGASEAGSGPTDMFIISDTTDPRIARAEEEAWQTLCARLGATNRLFYRRRRQNKGRKAGNVAEFCREWGGRYEHMIVLDADSIMTGETLLRLIRLMEANPGVGIIQTLPFPTNRDTVFSRAIQFACRLYGTMLARGFAFWQLGEGNYWGHNAIIRMQAFLDHCALPTLSGTPPLGGEILSHDFVEAALIRRGGWQVWTVPGIGGSFEEVPANLVDFAKRDRRWAQGNLQHIRLLGVRNFNPLSRAHLLMGVMAYAASPFWLITLCLSTFQFISEALTGREYFTPGYNLFPTWPVSKLSETMTLLGLTILMLLLPKAMALLLALFDGPERRGFGGGFRLVASAFIELFISMMQAPAMMLFHSHFVFTILTGSSVAWEAQPRDDRGLSFGEAFSRHGTHTFIGLVWGAVVLAIAPEFFWWLTPIVTGLVLSIPGSMLTSRVDIGRALKRWGLLLTPEETHPPAVLLDLHRSLIVNESLRVAYEPPEPQLAPNQIPERRPREMVQQTFDYWTLRGSRSRGSN